MDHTRFFYFSASYRIMLNGPFSETFGLETDHFPNRTELHGIVQDFNPGARDIIIMAISEVSLLEELLGLLPPGSGINKTR